MSKRTRYFVLASVAILLVGLTTGLVASYMGFSGVVFSRAAGPAELQYIPADAAVVAYTNVRQVMQSNFRERFRKFEPDTRERDEFEKQTGINIDNDIEHVVAAVVPATQGGRPDGSFLVIARGRFEQGRIEALAVQHGARAEEYRGKRLLSHADRQKQEMALAFLDADLVAFGGYESIKRGIDAAAGTSITSNNDVMRQIGELENSSAWAVGRFDALSNNAMRLPNEVRAQLPAIQWFSASTHINGGVSALVKAETRDEEAAQNLRDMMRGFLALGKMQASAKPEIKAVVDSIQLTGEGKTVAVSFALPTEIFDALEALGEAQRGHRRGQEPEAKPEIK